MLHLIGVSPLNSELPFLVFDESMSENFLLDKCNPDNTFFSLDRLRMGHRIYYRVRAEQGPYTKFIYGTPNGMGFTLQP